MKKLLLLLPMLACHPAESPEDVCLANAKANWDMAILSCATSRKGPEECGTQGLMEKRAEEENQCFR